MRNLKKAALLLLLTVVFSALSPSMAVLAETASTNDDRIIFREDFSGGSVNTSGSQNAIAAAKGLFVCNENGSTYTLEQETLNYMDRLSNDYVDLRFYVNGAEQDLARDFILSFRIKPKMTNIGMKFSWRDHAQQTSEDVVQISNGRLHINGFSYNDFVFQKDEWTLMEIAFHYSPNVRTLTGEKGAVDSFTVMLNGKKIDTVDAGIRFHNINLFRLFRYSSNEFEVDDLIIATGNESLAREGEYADWTPKSYFVDHESTTDYAYSFCIVGDTQRVTKHSPEKLNTIYRWILQNAEAKKIGFVFGVGDITDSDTVKEWNTARDAINMLNGVLPYSLILGNHDGSARFNEYFNNETYKKQFGGFFDDTINNSWTEINVGGVDYLMVALDFGARDNVLNWAGEVIEAHPNHRVIVTTHAYLYGDGTTLDSHDSWAPAIYSAGANSGEDICQKLIAKHKNIFMVISGHIPSDYVITTQFTGEHGNTVTQMLVNPQGVDDDLGSTGMVTMLYFSKDGKSVHVETYSTIHEKYFLNENQYTFDLGTWAAKTDAETEAPTEEEQLPDEPIASEQAPAGSSEKKGCGGVIEGSVWLLCLLAAAAPLMRRRHARRSQQ